MLPAFGLYTHIRANRIRSGILLAGLFFLVYLLVFAGALFAEASLDDASLGDLVRRALVDLLWASPVATLGTAAWVFIAYRFHQAIISLVTGSHAVTRREAPKLYNLLENLCVSRGLAMPRLFIMESGAVNAFATGLNERQYAVTVTRGLIEALDDAEMEAVLAHELTHIRNGDVQMMVIAVVVAGVVSFFGELFFRWFSDMPRIVRGSGRPSSGDTSSSDSKGKGQGGGGAFAAILIALALIAIAWFLSLVIRFALSRSREYLADAGAVELTKNPDAMIAALLKIAGKGELAHVPSGLMEMCVDNPREGFADLFATHPSIEDRIAALERYAGGRRPAPAAAEEGGAVDPGVAAPADPAVDPWGRQAGT